MDLYNKKTLLPVTFLMLILVITVVDFCSLLSHDATSRYTIPKLKSNAINLHSPSLSYRQTIPGTRSDGNNMYRKKTSSRQQNILATIKTDAERKKHLQMQCSALSPNNKRKGDMRHNVSKQFDVKMLTSPALSLIYCRVNKVASTYTLRVLGEILNCTKTCLRSFSDGIRRLPYESKREATRNAYKFMFVREPYGRLFSTYSNKFYFPKGNWIPIGIEIIRRFRKNPSQDSLKYGHDVTFAELIRYTIEEFEAGNKMDEHIRPMHTDCKPCAYDYDFIGKLETMTSDWNYLAHEWLSRNLTTSIPPNIGEKTGNILKGMFFFQLTLNKVKGSNISLYNLYKRVWNYFKITSVISKHIDMPFSRSDNSSLDYYSFYDNLKSARDQSEADATEVKGQYREAMLQAYSTVPLKDLERLKAVVREDCLLFGYNESPEWIFDRNTNYNESSSYDYFSGLN